jgi:acyl-CoA synthetase (AMP-forming)/AMP-acid ligase II
MPPESGTTLRSILKDGGDAAHRFLWTRNATVSLAELLRGRRFYGDPERFRGRSVLIATRDQYSTALALIELDGIARCMALMPPDIGSAQLSHVVVDAEIDIVATDAPRQDVGVLPQVVCASATSSAQPGHLKEATEWLLFTSGTTGRPKMVRHTLASLTGAIKRPAPDAAMVWSTFYDIRRYGGLQIFLRAMVDGGSLILSDADEPVAEFLARLGERGVTHISGTPSHWRRALMSPAFGAIAPRYIRLSGEIADQNILDALRAARPQARISHAYASTEAGVGFDVTDGREGFPATFLDGQDEPQMKVVDGSLRIRSNRAAWGYVGGTALADDDGFIDTGDMVEGRGDRYYFVGRKGGIINIGGLKVHPEEVEAVINTHPAVQMSLVRARKNPVTGAIVVADIVLKRTGRERQDDALKSEVATLCRERLAQHKVPAIITVVQHLAVGVAGKLVRHG